MFIAMWRRHTGVDPGFILIFPTNKGIQLRRQLCLRNCSGFKLLRFGGHLHITLSSTRPEYRHEGPACEILHGIGGIFGDLCQVAVSLPVPDSAFSNIITVHKIAHSINIQYTALLR